MNKVLVIIVTLGVLIFNLGCGKTLFTAGSDDFGSFDVKVNEVAQPEVSATFNTLGFVNWLTCLDFMSFAKACKEESEDASE